MKRKFYNCLIAGVATCAMVVNAANVDCLKPFRTLVVSAKSASSTTPKGGESKTVDHGFGIVDRYYNSEQCKIMYFEYAKEARLIRGLNALLMAGNMTYTRYYKAAREILGYSKASFNIVGIAGSMASSALVPILEWYSNRCYEGYRGNGLIFKCWSGWIPYEIDNQ